MHTVEIFYTTFTSPLDSSPWQHYLDQLPLNYHQRILRYRRWQDQHSTLLSYLLLKQALLTVGYQDDCLTQLQTGEHGRPFIDDGSLDFNLSHSGDYVVCALLKAGRVGIDIERIRPIEVADFKGDMSEAEWLAISTPTVSYHKFYDYWTMKESVMKADGRGLYLPLRQIMLQGPQALVENTLWFLHKVVIHPEYACHIATSLESIEISVKEIRF